MGNLPDFFSKKESESDVVKKLKTQISTVKKASKPLVKPPAKKPSVKKATALKMPQAPKTRLVSETATFYSQPIRKVYYKNRWYFFLKDVIAISGVLNLEEDLDRVKRNKEYKEDSSKYIVSVPVVINDQTETVECIDNDGFMWILPLVRNENRVFPGPFPNWIKALSEAPI